MSRVRKPSSTELPVKVSLRRSKLTTTVLQLAALASGQCHKVCQRRTAVVLCVPHSFHPPPSGKPAQTRTHESAGMGGGRRTRVRLPIRQTTTPKNEKVDHKNAHPTVKATASLPLLTFTGVCDQLAKGVTRFVTAGHWTCDTKTYIQVGGPISRQPIRRSSAQERSVVSQSSVRVKVFRTLPKVLITFPNIFACMQIKFIKERDRRFKGSSQTTNMEEISAKRGFHVPPLTGATVKESRKKRKDTNKEKRKSSGVKHSVSLCLEIEPIYLSDALEKLQSEQWTNGEMSDAQSKGHSKMERKSCKSKNPKVLSEVTLVLTEKDKSDLTYQEQDSLRWEGVLEDPVAEAQRLEMYKTNRRKRYLASKLAFLQNNQTALCIGSNSSKLIPLNKPGGSMEGFVTFQT
ncbi:hypothetical protein E1301_Tti012363 [Triplophysa tibetana]|uniref:Protein LIAT1 n=1 Tax=Triplophysa tibetana TaxID=1572043 RepID=A0A5A9PH75_9TELE|nr:hypothetical protein E1301_Tti012363 [Triplophysa tibetana]